MYRLKFVSIVLHEQKFLHVHVFSKTHVDLEFLPVDLHIEDAFRNGGSN